MLRGVRRERGGLLCDRRRSIQAKVPRHSHDIGCSIQKRLYCLRTAMANWARGGNGAGKQARPDRPSQLLDWPDSAVRSAHAEGHLVVLMAR